jgi:hypothetical protein
MVMTAVSIEEGSADAILTRFRGETGFVGELKGSRIDLTERALLWDMFRDSGGRAAVSIAISAVKPDPGADHGDHDIDIYTRLMNDSVSALLPPADSCTTVIMDTGRYHDKILSRVRGDIADLIGPWNTAHMQESDKLAGLQIADVIANTFFNRALPNDIQSKFWDITEPFLASGQVEMRILPDF